MVGKSILEETEEPEEYTDEFPHESGPVTWRTWIWIFLMSAWVIGTGLILYFTMGNNYVTIPNGTFPLR